MNATTATDFITTNKGADIEIVLTNGDSVFGSALSVNSKGVNVKDDDGKTRSVSLARIESLELVEDDTFDSDDHADDDAAAAITELEEIYAMLTDGMTTADLADALSDHLNIALTPKELRVHLRALGLGVGKGRKYALSASEFRAVRALIVANA
jgi:hypothetical protein